MADKETPTEKVQTFEEKHAALITAKMNAGLTHHAAIQVIKDQLENDAQLAKSKKK